MSKQVCVKCQVEFRCKENGVSVVEMFSHPPQPYKVWGADLWECPKCGHQIISGFGFQAIAEHFQENFKQVVEKAKALGEVYYDYEK